MFKIVDRDMNGLDCSKLVDKGYYSLIVLGSSNSKIVDSYINFSYIGNEIICEEMDDDLKDYMEYNEDYSMEIYIDLICLNWYEDDREIYLIRLS